MQRKDENICHNEYVSQGWKDCESDKYTRLWSFAIELMHGNLGATVKIQVDRECKKEDSVLVVLCMF